MAVPQAQGLVVGELWLASSKRGLGDWETGRLGDWETRRLGDWGTGRLGDWGTRGLVQHGGNNPPVTKSSKPYQSILLYRRDISRLYLTFDF